MENVILWSAVFFLGIFFGSFSNVVIFRLHSGEKGILGGRSHCQSCQHELGFWDLFPVFSWLFLRGKCRYCSEKISWQYPLVELFMGAFWVFLFAMLGISVEGIMAGTDVLKAIWAMAFGFFFVVLFVADLRFTEVYEQISYPAIFLAFLSIFLFPEISWQNALLGAAIPTVFFGGQILLSRYVFTSRGEWVGTGDLDFGIIMGLILGWKLVLVALFLAYILGSLVGIPLLLKGEGEKMVPFGPFLLASLMICWFWGNQILDWYLGLLF